MTSPIIVPEGDIFKSKAQTLVNTVNCVGVMGKGIALGFRRRYPEMHDDYVLRCERGEVKLGRPYVYRRAERPWILNFPTKDHWRSVSRLADIERGLDYLVHHYQDWGIESLAVPPLGSGLGGLEWHVVGPTLYRYLERLSIPVELYVPHGTPHEELQPAYLQRSLLGPVAPVESTPIQGRIGASWVALLEAVNRLEREPHSAPIGRTLFQKLAYFATVAGLDLGLNFKRGSYGPFAPEMKRYVSHLLNNGLIIEQRRGQMFEVKLGATFEAAERAFVHELESLEPTIERLVDLFSRMRSPGAEVAATVHYAAAELTERRGSTPTEADVLTAVMDWKQRRKPPLDHATVAQAVRGLNVLGWIKARPSDDLGIDPELQLMSA